MKNKLHTTFCHPELVDGSHPVCPELVEGSHPVCHPELVEGSHPFCPEVTRDLNDLTFKQINDSKPDNEVKSQTVTELVTEPVEVLSKYRSIILSRYLPQSIPAECTTFSHQCKFDTFSK